MRRWSLALLAFLLAPGALAAQNEALVGRPEITRIRFAGNATFPTDTLQRAIFNRETECRSPFNYPGLNVVCATGFGFAKDRHYLSVAELPRDVARLQVYYRQRGYREASVTPAITARDPGQVELSFTIDEGQPVRVDSLAVLVSADLDDPSLIEDLPLEKGDPLSAIAVEATRDSLETRLHDAGYAYALVLLRNDLPVDSHSATVIFDVDPGPRARFGPIDVQGNVELSDDVVRRMAGIREGDPYGTTRILDAQRNLFALEIVQYARVDTLPAADLDTIIPLRIEITEGDEYRVRAGAGWSTAECLSTEATWTARNFIGGARRLQVRARLSNVLAERLQDPFCAQAGVGAYGRLNWLVAADFSQPWIFSPRNSLSLGLYGERTSLPDVFVREAVGVNAALVRALGRGASLALSYRPQLSNLEAAEVFFCTSFLACDPADIAILQSASWLAPVGMNLSANRTDNLLNPRAGYRASLDLEHASRITGSNYAYSRALAEASSYRGVGAGALVAARLRGGWIGPGQFSLLPGTGAGREVVHPQKRFFAGGSNSVRGVAQNRLGPKVLTVDVKRLLVADSVGGVAICTVAQVMALTCDASTLDEGAFTPRPTGGTRLLEGNLELRFPLTAHAFEGVGFVDFGQVWAESQKPSLGDLVWTPGVGIRWYTAIGPIRLDLGYHGNITQSLSVVTSQVEPCTPSPSGSSCEKITPETGFARAGQLAVLGPRVPFDRDPIGDDGKPDWSLWRHLQFQFSIGQAF